MCGVPQLLNPPWEKGPPYRCGRGKTRLRHVRTASGREEPQNVAHTAREHGNNRVAGGVTSMRKDGAPAPPMCFIWGPVSLLFACLLGCSLALFFGKRGIKMKSGTEDVDLGSLPVKDNYYKEQYPTLGRDEASREGNM